MVETNLATVASEFADLNPTAAEKRPRERGSHQHEHKHKHKKHKHKHRKDRKDRVRGADSEPESGEIVTNGTEAVASVTDLSRAATDGIFSHPKSVTQDSLRVGGRPDHLPDRVEHLLHGQTVEEKKHRRDASQHSEPRYRPDVTEDHHDTAVSLDKTSDKPNGKASGHRNCDVPDRKLTADVHDTSRPPSRSRNEPHPVTSRDARLLPTDAKHSVHGRSRSRSPAGSRKAIDLRDQPARHSRSDNRYPLEYCREDLHHPSYYRGGHPPAPFPSPPDARYASDYRRPGQDCYQDFPPGAAQGRHYERTDRPRDRTEAGGRDQLGSRHGDQSARGREGREGRNHEQQGGRGRDGQERMQQGGRDRGQAWDRERESGRGHERPPDKRSRSRERPHADDKQRADRPDSKRRKQEEEQLDEDMALVAFGEDEEAELKRIEESRRRRQEILQKHKAIDAVVAPTATALAHLELSPTRSGPSAGPSQAPPTPPAVSSMPSPSPADGEETPAPQHMFENEGTPEGDLTSSTSDGNADGPVLDIFNEEDEANSRAVEEAAAVVPAGDRPAAAMVDDMFAEEVPDDMFAEAPVARPTAAPALGLVDAYDDPEGYYKFQVGEMMDGRYEVFALKGKGVFSTVVRARDMQSRDETGAYTEVAIKMIRSNEVMYKAGQQEQVVLKALAAQDPDNRKHCIQMLRAFEYRSHLCLVFEPMDLNLRELTAKYGRNVGLNIKAVAQYAAQLLTALRHLKKCNVLHSDIKPDNILVNQRRTKIKICDFGSAMFRSEAEITPYMASRFYRPPEVILGLKYDFAMDMWSIGCVLYELFTGKILFPGVTNNDMLRLFMEVQGPMPKKMLKKGVFSDTHFDQTTGTSTFVQLDPTTKQPVRRVIPAVKNRISALLGRADGQDRIQVANLADLLDKMLMLDPERRITPEEAMRHPFVREYVGKKTAHGAKHAEQTVKLSKK